MLVELFIGMAVLLSAESLEVTIHDEFHLPVGECLEVDNEYIAYKTKVCCRPEDRLEGAKGIDKYDHFFKDPLANRRPLGAVLLRCVKADDPNTPSEFGPTGSLTYGEVTRRIDCKGLPMYGPGSRLRCVMVVDGAIKVAEKEVYLSGHTGNEILYDTTYLDGSETTITQAWWNNGQVAIEWMLTAEDRQVCVGKHFDIKGREVTAKRWNNFYGVLMGTVRQD